VLVIVHEHFKVIGGAMRSLQRRALLVEGQLEKLERLQGQVAECIASRVDRGSTLTHVTTPSATSRRCRMIWRARQ
jgi:hypothetical protein